MQNAECKMKVSLERQNLKNNFQMIGLYRYRAGNGKNDYCPGLTRIGMKRPCVSNWNLIDFVLIIL